MNKHVQYAVCIAILLVLAVPAIIHAQFGGGGKYFGGRITFAEYCNDGELLLVDEPMKGEEWFFWRYGNLPYLMYVVPHIGQNLIGKASNTTQDCYLGDDYIGNGYPIQYHGESN